MVVVEKELRMSLAMRVAEAVQRAAARVAYPSDEHFRRSVELGQVTARVGIEALDLEQIIAEVENDAGCWQREMPTKPGKYWVRTSDGLDAGLNTVCFSSTLGGAFCPEYQKLDGSDRFGGQTVPGTSWRGWWWSEPISPIPPFTKT